MPVWHEALKKERQQGRVRFVGVIQEQHPERCRLFAQWKQFEWPILHDPINLLMLRGVPMVIAIDEHGVVRSTRPRLEEIRATFVDHQFQAPEQPPERLQPVRPHLGKLRSQARRHQSFADWKRLGDALMLWHADIGADEAIAAYETAARLRPEAAEIQFRLGVAQRRRYEVAAESAQATATPTPTERLAAFQAAIDSWNRALQLDPNHYIYRRRIQQYGPRLNKPYPFYDWVFQARGEIRSRGQTPIAMAVEPGGAEIAHPTRKFVVEDRSAKPPDPQGRIRRDAARLIRSAAVVVPGEVKAGESVRVHLVFEPARQAHWNNEAEPLVAWVEVPEGWTAEKRRVQAKLPPEPETRERRVLELELQVADLAAGVHKLNAYALYYVCEEQGGTCLYLRQDLEIPVRVK